jgi:uncharacterized protein YqgV (UPF0045/DUF77 family)
VSGGGPFPDVDAHVVDTNLFIVFERNGAVSLLRRAAKEYGVVLLLPQRVYEELTPAALPYEVPPVDAAIEAGWVQVIEGVDQTNPVVSSTMDMVRRYIAVADNRPEHEIEQADAEVGGATAMLLTAGRADSVAVYTNDRAAFRGIERALASHGYGDQVELVNSFDFYKQVRNRYPFDR